MTLHLGMIGAGWIAREHVASISALEGAELAAVADLDAGGDCDGCSSDP